MEFIRMCGEWIAEHKDQILLVVTSSQFIGLVVAIFKIIKTKKVTEANTASTESLNGSIAKLQKFVSDLEALKQTVDNLDTKLTSIEEVTIENKNQIDLIINKLNAQIDAQSQVWSTIKDDELKESVQNVLTNAKYLETSNVVELRKQVESLQEKLNAKTTDIKNEIAETVQKVQKVVKSKVQRA